MINWQDVRFVEYDNELTPSEKVTLAAWRYDQLTKAARYMAENKPVYAPWALAGLHSWLWDPY